MAPGKALPFGHEFDIAKAYVDSLLDFVGTNHLLRTLCGGVHVLDFFTSEPGVYSTVLPREWRVFFDQHDVLDILDLLVREEDFLHPADCQGQGNGKWRNGPLPPRSLVEYIMQVRKHLLLRRPTTSQCARNRATKPMHKLARHETVGMTIKKTHEVALLASYIGALTDDLNSSSGLPVTHLVDFGSGQNYLGRALASEPYNCHIVAIESESHNADRARQFDVTARLAARQKVMRNKKDFRAARIDHESPACLPTLPSEPFTGQPLDATVLDSSIPQRIQYVEQQINDGHLSSVISNIGHPSPSLLVMSLHSCGNLVHHGMRSLILNPTVRAVAMVGCCYNLLTERFGPATYKHADLRPTTHLHPRLHGMEDEGDPHGFPMSARLCAYNVGHGMRLNITARMMAVQAPANWGERDSASFFTRHFYRALLQRIFLDRGVVGPPSVDRIGSESPAGHSSGTPVIIGSLRKSCYSSFSAYVRGALVKLANADDETGRLVKTKMDDLADADIAAYEAQFQSRKKELSIMWSLMAFSAGVIEATIVVDRWLWLQEQDEVGQAWVEPVFDYAISPRNLVVVGIKK